MLKLSSKKQRKNALETYANHQSKVLTVLSYVWKPSVYYIHDKWNIQIKT